MNRRISVFAPKAPHPDSLADGELIIQNDAQQLLVMYCPRNRTGGLYYVEMGTWALQTPIAFGDFLAFLKQRDIQLPDGPDLQRWLDRVEAVTLLVHRNDLPN